jgi:hypothetical protein
MNILVGVFSIAVDDVSSVDCLVVFERFVRSKAADSVVIARGTKGASMVSFAGTGANHSLLHRAAADLIYLIVVYATVSRPPEIHQMSGQS